MATPTPNLDVTAAFTSTRHRGELPWGGAFGFSNDVEVALPYDSRTNDVTLGTEWTNGRQMLRVAYDGSWFNNLDDTLTWDSPLRLTDSSGAPGSGRMALWPTNSAQTVSAAGYSKFAHRTQITGFISFGRWNNNQPLQPFTDQLGAAEHRAAENHGGGRRPRLLDQPEPGLPPERRTGISRARAGLRLQQQHAAHGYHAVRRPTTRRSARPRPAARSSTRTTARPSTPTPPGPGSSRWR